VGVVTCGATAALDALLPAAASPPPLLSLSAPAPPTTVMLALPAIVKLSVQLSVPLGGRSAGALQTGVGLPGKLAALGMAQKACGSVLLPVLVQFVVQLPVAPPAAVAGLQRVVLSMSGTARSANRLPVDPSDGTLMAMLCAAVLPATLVSSAPGAPLAPVV